MSLPAALPGSDMSDANKNSISIHCHQYEPTDRTAVMQPSREDRSIDAGVLRKALRLIHCLQKERGATCAHQSVARNMILSKQTNNDAHHKLPSSKPLSPARRDTDRAFALLLHNHRFQIPMDTNLPMEKETLDKIRKLVLDPVKDQRIDEESASQPVITSNHQLLKLYSALIQSLSHEYILRHTTAAKHRCDELQRRQEQQQLPRINGSRKTESRNDPPGPLDNIVDAISMQSPILRQSRSSHALNALLSETPKSHRAHKRTSSSDASFKRIHSTSPMAPLSIFSPSLDEFAYGVSIEHDSSDDETYPQRRETEEGGLQWDFFETNDDDHMYHSDEERIWRLLHLLDVFLRLKESTGVERATLASIVMDTSSSIARQRHQQSTATSSDSDNHNLLLNDLVTEVENQRRQIANLDRLLPRTGALHNLVSELVRMSPQMKRLQESIAKGFDILESRQLGLDFQKQELQGGLWNLLTLYIDKLHSLELLIVQEVECCIGLRSLGGDVPLVVDYSNSSCHVENQHSIANNFSNQRLDGNSSDQNLLILRGDCFGLPTVGCTSDELRERIESMPAEEVKKHVLSAVATQSGKYQPHSEGNGDQSEISAADDSAEKGVEDLLADLCKAPAMKEWEIDLYEIKFKRRIGQGNAGTTYLADWKGSNVAVKVASITEMGLDGWRNEVQNLQRLHHPNIIRLLGSVYHQSPLTFCLVLEYCDGGELTDALQRPTPPNFFFRVADSIAKGIAYLHTRQVIHRDIKPSNVLLEGNVKSGPFMVKITDFGLATAASLSGDRTAETGTYRWMVRVFVANLTGIPTSTKIWQNASYGPSRDSRFTSYCKR